MGNRILIIEDESSMRVGLSHLLITSGYDVKASSDGNEGMSLIRDGDFDLVITDMRLPGCDGMEILRYTKEISPDTGVIIITAYAEVKTAVEAMKEGAFDYISKPFTNEEILIIVERYFKFKNLEDEVIKLKRYLTEDPYFEGIIGVSSVMRDLFDRIRSVSDTDVTVLIYGESGTGKELVANAIHNLSTRKNKPFVKINCAAIPESLFESELFGHEKGAFTGATMLRKGKFEVADGGSIFFDEIGDMPLGLQAKLLRVIEDHTVTRLGGYEPLRVDVRCIFATSKNLRELVNSGRFREDLYYRINVIPLYIPPLRERREDIPHLIKHFLEEFSRKFLRPLPHITPQANQILLDYDYPGNVRELKHAIERAVILSRNGLITEKDLPEEMLSNSKKPVIIDSSLRKNISSYEREFILSVLKKTGGKKVEAARLLGISRKSLWKKLKEYNIDIQDTS